MAPFSIAHRPLLLPVAAFPSYSIASQPSTRKGSRQEIVGPLNAPYTLRRCRSLKHARISCPGLRRSEHGLVDPLMYWYNQYTEPMRYRNSQSAEM